MTIPVLLCYCVEATNGDGEKMRYKWAAVGHDDDDDDDDDDDKEEQE